ncbi:cell division protein ZipA [Dasania marina]|uniref:cell division protein ZipA n=1 Tax=Dasania marina TaxID=471499 RepID=UPI00037245BA|nr:cell division protein ZipA [Dasania marina]
MELGVRDWMIIVGILLIAVVLFDGFRRMRNDRRGKIRMSLNKNFVNSSGDIDEPVNKEVLGGPRVIPRKPGDAMAKPAYADDDLQLDEDVPMLMESISATDFSDEEVLAGDAFESVTELDTESELGSELDSELGSELGPEFEAEPEADYEVAAQEQESLEPVYEGNDDNSYDDDNDPLFASNKPQQQELDVMPADDSDQANRNLGPEEVIIINVMAKGKPFKGADLLHILLACDCRFGDMNIFHRYESASGIGPVQFSIVNSVEPGIFDLDNIEQFSTPGVCFFVKVPGPQKPIQAFDYMVETAQCLAKNLNGELRDETRSVMTGQTLEHCRNRIREIERKQLTHA